jgi:sulfopyruvate decarboxylase TPP-binding subunit
MGGTGSVAIMGASGFMTIVYAITKISYSYEIPLLTFITLRGAFGDHHKHHVSNGLYLRPVMDAISLPYMIVDTLDEIKNIRRAYDHTMNYARPVVVALTHDLLK